MKLLIIIIRIKMQTFLKIKFKYKKTVQKIFMFSLIKSKFTFIEKLYKGKEGVL